MSQEGKRVIDMSYDEARNFFLKNESYFNLRLPKYFDFSNLLNNISSTMWEIDKYGKTVKNGVDPNDLEDVNYKFFINKDWKYWWRKLQFIHPVLYVYLVHHITKKNNWKKILARIEKLSNNEIIYCASWPKEKWNEKTDTAENINSWLHDYEEYSLELSLDFRYIFKTDITSCYWSIYTHSIPWALHDKKIIKNNLHNLSKYYWDWIDKAIRAMSNRQTNGIPEWSVLMDFIAELVLLYIDSELIKWIKHLKSKMNNKFKIVRFRDDYHIFVNDPEFWKEIIKKLSSILASMWMKLNNEKTVFSENIILNSLKKDKIARFKEFNNFWAMIDETDVNKKDKNNTNENNKKIDNKDKKEKWIKWVKKQLLLINSFSCEYPNSWSVLVLLNNFSKVLDKGIIKSHTDIKVLIAILVDIGYTSPKAYPNIFNVLSKLIDYLDKEDDKREILDKVYEKLSRLPKSEYLDLRIQRLWYKTSGFNESEKLCIQFNNQKLWEIRNNNWLKPKYKSIMDSWNIIDETVKSEVTHIIPREETNPYDDYSY